MGQGLAKEFFKSFPFKEDCRHLLYQHFLLSCFIKSGLISESSLRIPVTGQPGGLGGFFNLT